MVVLLDIVQLAEMTVFSLVLFIGRIGASLDSERLLTHALCFLMLAVLLFLLQFHRPHPYLCDTRVLDGSCEVFLMLLISRRADYERLDFLADDFVLDAVAVLDFDVLLEWNRGRKRFLVEATIFIHPFGWRLGSCTVFFFGFKQRHKEF